MGNVNKNDDENNGMKRAADFSNALCDVPGYGDDSLFFIVRYVGSLQEKLQEREFLEFMGYLGELKELTTEGDKAPEGSAPKSERAEAAKQKAYNMIKDDPQLSRDFDPFMTKLHTANTMFGPLSMA